MVFRTSRIPLCSLTLAVIGAATFASRPTLAQEPGAPTPSTSSPSDPSVPATTQPPTDVTGAAPAVDPAAADPNAAAPAADAPKAPPKIDEDEVSVTGTRLVETAGSTHVIKDKQLRRFAYDDAHQVLLAVPGVYVRPEDGMGLRPNIGIRGANSDRSKKITLMEDGVLVGPAPYSAPAAYYFPLIDRMRTVRVLKGPSAIVFGPQTVGGAVDVITREIPDGRKGTYDLAFGQYGFNKQHLTFGMSDEHAGFLVEGMRVDNYGFKDLPNGGNTGFTRNEWMAKAMWNPAPRATVQNELILKAEYADETSNETYLGLTDADLRATPDRRYLASRDDQMVNHRTALALTHKLTFSPKVDMVTTAYRHDYARIWRKVNGIRGADISDVLANPTTPRNTIYKGLLTGEIDATDPTQAILIGPNNRQFVSQGIQTLVRVAAKTGPIAHRFTYGARAHYDEIVRKHTQDGFLTRGGELVPDGLVTQVTAQNKASTHALAMWATDAMTMGPVVLTPGLRVEAIGAQFQDYLAKTSEGATYHVFIPGVGAYWEMIRGLGLLAGVHKGFSPVVPEQASTSKPEASVNYEAGLRYSRKYLRAEVIGFYNDYSNLTNICTFSGGCTEANLDRQSNAGQARIAGLEVFADSEPPIGKGWVMPMRVSYTYTYTEFLNTFSSADPQFGNVRAGDELPYVPTNQLTGTIGVEQKRFGVNVAWTFVDSMWERAGRGEPLPGQKTDAYFLLDGSVKYRVFDFLELYVNGRNLTNDRYIGSRRPFGARPGAPLWVMAGVRGEF